MSTQENRTASKLDNVIEKALTKLAEETPGTKEFAAVEDQLTKLLKAKEIEITLNLKAIESFSKQNESNATVKLKEADIKAKQAESAATVKLKETEIRVKDQELLIKQEDAHTKARQMTTELELKTEESAANVKLKELEIAVKEKELAFPLPVKAEVLVPAATSLAGILMILSYERVNIITTKALGFVSKLR